MIDNPLQFAVVREDPLVEASVIDSTTRSVLLVASGGCTALSLASLCPHLQFTLLDMNGQQLDHVRHKLSALSGPDLNRDFNIGDDSPSGLNETGNFESLFRGFRKFVYEFVISYSDLKQNLASGTLAEVAPPIFAKKYWRVAFELYFSDTLLNAMFGPAATQHAPKGSYPGYFRGVIEKGMTAPHHATNYFLHHILLGHYLADKAAWPLYLQKPPTQCHFRYVQASLESGQVDFGEFDLVDLSNLFDWMEPGLVVKIADTLCRQMKPGAQLLFRQLNNDRDLQSLFRSAFDFDLKKENELRMVDRSLFYCRLNLGKRK